MRVCNHCPLAAAEKNQGRQNFRNTRWDGVLVQLLSHVRLFVTLIGCSTPGSPVLHYLLEFAQIHFELVMLSNYLILCYPLLLE